MIEVKIGDILVLDIDRVDDPTKDYPEPWYYLVVDLHVTNNHIKLYRLTDEHDQRPFGVSLSNVLLDLNRPQKDLASSTRNHWNLM